MENDVLRAVVQTARYEIPSYQRDLHLSPHTLTKYLQILKQMAGDFCNLGK